MPRLYPLTREEFRTCMAKRRERGKLIFCPACNRSFRDEELYKAHYKQEHKK